MTTTRIGQMAQELSRMNPWWRGRDWQDRDPDLVAAADSGLGYRSGCLKDLKEGGLYLLRGPRRVGKTVAVKQAIEDLLASGVPASSIVRVAADGWSAGDLRTVIQNTAMQPVPTGRSRWWFIDEVTATTGDWATQVKWLRDNDPTFSTDTVTLTGSNAESLTAAAGTLAGRRGRAHRADRTLLPIGFRTFARLLQPNLPLAEPVPLSHLRDRSSYMSLLAWLDDLVRLWELYLRSGGFPVSVAAAKAGEPVPGWFVDDVFSVIFGDAFSASRLSVTTTMALVARLVEGIGSPANLNAVGSDVGVSQEVVSRHVRYLRDAYLLWHCPQKSERYWTPRLRAQDKLYPVDPVIARLPFLRNSARSDVDPSVLTEMLIGMAIHRAAYGAGQRWADDQFLFFARTPARKEIDFVGEPLAGVAIESKYVESGTWKSAAATVEASPWKGLLVTRNVLDCRGAEAWAVPAGILAYLVDT